MDFAQPDFDKFFDFNQPVWEQAKTFKGIAMATFNEAAQEQLKAAQAVVDFSVQTFSLPETTDAGELLNKQVELNTKLAETLGESAQKIFSIAETARDQAVSALTPDAQ